MAAVDLSLPFREALVVRMRGSSSVTALLPANSIYGERVPANKTWPFSKLSHLTSEPFLATGVNGQEFPFRVNTFTQGEDTDQIHKINRVIINLLDDAELPMDEGWALDIRFVRSQVINDTADTNGYHGLLDFVALVGVDA